MGNKIFVSYKYHDRDVKPLPGAFYYTSVRDYVNYIENKIIDPSDSIYKGERDNEDLSGWSDDYIWARLKDRIYDSSLTIVLISPNMKEPYRHQKSQWIPWEISYSLRETPRGDRTSHNNAILAVVLPDHYGNYDYYNRMPLFPILQDNIDNGYIHVTSWEQFIRSPRAHIRQAYINKENTPTYKIAKAL